MNRNKYMKRYSTPLVIREMQFNITMRYYFIISNLTKLRWLLISSVAKDTDQQEFFNTDEGSVNWNKNSGKQFGIT